MSEPTPFAPDLLQGKVAFVVGGTRGMNLEIARRYAEHGAKVAVLSRNPDRCAAAAQDLRDRGAEALGIPGDVRDFDGLADATATVARKLGPIDILVAGQAGNFYAPAHELSANGFKTIIDIDLCGTFNVFRAGFDHLNKPGACLIAITAPEGSRPLHFQSHVCAAKAGLNMLLKCLALEWGPAGVRVMGLSPGPILDSWGMDNVVAPNEATVEHIRRALPLQRWGTMAEVADGALFLVTDAARYITGTVLDVDGGTGLLSPESGRVDALAGTDPRVTRRKP